MVPVGASRPESRPVGGSQGASPKRLFISMAEGHVWVDDILMKARFRTTPRTCRRVIGPKNRLHTIPENEALVIKTVLRSPMIHLSNVKWQNVAKIVPKSPAILPSPTTVVPAVETVPLSVESREQKAKKRGFKFWSAFKLATPNVRDVFMIDRSLLNFV